MLGDWQRYAVNSNPPYAITANAAFRRAVFDADRPLRPPHAARPGRRARPPLQRAQRPRASPTAPRPSPATATAPPSAASSASSSAGPTAPAWSPPSTTPSTAARARRPACATSARQVRGLADRPRARSPRGRGPPRVDLEDAWFGLMRQVAWYVGARAGMCARRPRLPRRGAGAPSAEARLPEPPGLTASGDSRRGQCASSGRRNTISGTTQFGEVRSRNRTDSARSSGWIISSAATCSFTNSVIGVSTNPGASAVTWIPCPATSFCVDWLEADHRRLGRRVDRQPRLRRLAGDRGGVDDQRLAVLGARLAQHRQALPRHQHHRPQVDVRAACPPSWSSARASPRRSRPRRC